MKEFYKILSLDYLVDLENIELKILNQTIVLRAQWLYAHYEPYHRQRPVIHISQAQILMHKG